MDSAHLLIVDDNEMNRDMLSRRVHRQGFTFDMAENGRQALELLASAVYDLVLLDIMMPEVDGYQVLERIKAHSELRHIPVIMISAIDDIENMARCIEMGADDYLTKPFNPTILRARLHSSLAKKRLRDQEQLYAKSLEREMEIGRQIQAGFLPQTLPQHPDWELASLFRPARTVAGDFYDAFDLPVPGYVGLVVADVCDKGVGAALFMALIRSLIRSNAANFFANGGPIGVALQKTVAQTNEYIAITHGDANMFATLFFGVLDLAENRLTYINAGHDPPLVVRAAGGRQFIEPTGIVVGVVPGFSFPTAQLQIDRGDLVVCYTDGITEAQNQDGEFWGDEALKALPASLSAAEALARIEADLGVFVGAAEQTDDITMLALKRKGA
ncbi:MAG: SpoIIE family protein phosphatase [Anaerolineae bacterium]|jgi:serine phosphatase RsbU (regulator of sigma subunit)